MVCIKVLWQSFVGVGGDLVFVDRVYHFITYLFMWMHVIHRMQSLFKGSGICPNILQSYP